MSLTRTATILLCLALLSASSLRAVPAEKDPTKDQGTRAAVEKGLATGRLKGGERLKATMRLQVQGLELDVTFDDDISLE